MATAQEKIAQAAQTVKDKAIEAKDYVASGGNPPTAGDKAAEAAKAAKDKAIEAKDYVARGGKSPTVGDKAGGALQKTGGQIMGVAQGAADAVKNTLGFGENKVHK